MEKELKRIRRRQDKLFEGMDLILKAIHDSNEHTTIKLISYSQACLLSPSIPQTLPRLVESPSISTSSPAKEVSNSLFHVGKRGSSRKFVVL
ncbi:putative nesprin-1 isoform X4 [Sesbania bispinosa]|nr:putative nesprin-1 isoform X4 [Sesbania bispinosa]